MNTRLVRNSDPCCTGLKVVLTTMQSTFLTCILQPRRKFFLLLLVLLCSPSFSRTDTLFLTPLPLTKVTHFPLLRLASPSYPHPTFSNCTQNDVTTAHRRQRRFRKKHHVYYLDLFRESKIYFTLIKSWGIQGFNSPKFKAHIKESNYKATTTIPSAIQGNASICPSDPITIIYF